MSSSNSTNLFLGILGIVFLPYGVFCFIDPGFLAGAAGVTGSTPTGVAEIRAMYGGLQAGFGVLLIVAARDPRLTLAGLAAVAFVIPSLAVTRLLGVAIGGGLSGYTIGALVFEVGSSCVAIPMFRSALARR